MLLLLLLSLIAREQGSVLVGEPILSDGSSFVVTSSNEFLISLDPSECLGLLFLLLSDQKRFPKIKTPSGDSQLVYNKTTFGMACVQSRPFSFWFKFFKKIRRWSKTSLVDCSCLLQNSICFRTFFFPVLSRTVEKKE